jgi:hypothetical protein
MFSLALGVLLLLHASVVHADTDRQTRTVPLPAGRAITLDITIGQVRIEGASQPDVTIEIVRHAPNSEGLARIPVEIVEEESDVRIRAVQADGATDPTLRTDVTLRVPHGATLRSVRIMEGRLTIAALRGAITADIRRGTIDGRDVEGTIRLESGIGDVVLDNARLSANGLLRLRAFNGDVRLTLAEHPADARILALALNGTIRSEIPLTTKTSWGPRWGEATLGKGEPVISLDVITGVIDIKVKKNPSAPQI